MEGVGLEGKKPQRCASSNDHTFSRCFRVLFVKPCLLFRSVREPRCIAQMWLFFTSRVKSLTEKKVMYLLVDVDGVYSCCRR